MREELELNYSSVSTMVRVYTYKVAEDQITRLRNGLQTLNNVCTKAKT